MVAGPQRGGRRVLVGGRAHRDRRRLRRGRHPHPAGRQRAALPRADRRHAGRRGAGHRTGPLRALADEHRGAGRRPPLAPPVRLDRCLRRRRPRGQVAGQRPAPPASLRGGDPRRLVGLLDALPPDDGPGRLPGEHPVRPRALGAVARHREAGGRRAARRHRRLAALPGPGPADRHPGRRGPRGGRTTGRLPAADPERRVPGAVQPRPARPPRRLRRAGRRDHQGAARPAGRARDRRRSRSGWPGRAAPPR